MRHKGKAKQARFGASNPTLGVTSIVASQDCNEYLYSPEKSGSNKKKLNQVKYIHKIMKNRAHQLITVLAKYT